jgi:hypothetical protein
MRLDGADIGWRHVHGDGLDLRATAFQAFPEGFEGIGPLPISHKHDRPRFQVQDHRQVSMPSTDRDFIDRDPTEMLELNTTEPAAQGTFLNALNQVPTDPQMLGHIPDGHVLRQLQNVTLEGMGVGTPLVGEVHRHLANLAAVDTAYPWHIQLDLNRSGPDGKTAKATGLKSPPYDTPGPASRTAKISTFLADRECHPASLIRGLHVLVAPNPKPMVQ